MLGSGSPASLTVMMMTVMMMMMGEPDPRMNHVGVGFPRRIYKKIFISYCDRGGGTRPQHDIGRAIFCYFDQDFRATLTKNYQATLTYT